MSKPLFIGVDGGATSCRARLSDLEGNFLGEGLSGPANIHLNLPQAVQSIRLACARAFEAAGLDRLNSRRVHAGLGLAGAGIKSARDCLSTELRQFASVIIDSDAYVAWLGAHQANDGAIVILGTGSCGLAIIGGQRIAVGGWGAEISDEAGGQRMGRELLRRTLWAFDGRAERTALSDVVLKRFEWDPAKIVCFASGAAPADYAEFAPLIFQYATAKDPLAVAIVEETADAAARIVDRLIKAGAHAISLVGGLAEPLSTWLPPRVRDVICDAKSDPLDGAVLMARLAFFKLESVSLRAS